MRLTMMAVMLALAAASAMAQVSVSVGGAGGVNVNTGGAGGVSVDTGSGGTNVTTGKTTTSTKGNAVYTNPGQSSSSITHSPGTTVTTGKGDDAGSGVSVVNGNVTIDGVKVPPSATRWTGKDGTKYRIKRSGKGNVSVEEIDD